MKRTNLRSNHMASHVSSLPTHTHSLIQLSLSLFQSLVRTVRTHTRVTLFLQRHINYPSTVSVQWLYHSVPCGYSTENSVAIQCEIYTVNISQDSCSKNVIHNILCTYEGNFNFNLLYLSLGNSMWSVLDGCTELLSM